MFERITIRNFIIILSIIFSIMIQKNNQIPNIFNNMLSSIIILFITFLILFEDVCIGLITIITILVLLSKKKI